MDREHIEREELEHKLREYFRAEADEAEPSPQWWQRALTNLGQQQRPRRWFSMPAGFLSTRPFQAALASLTLALVVGGISLLVLSRWSGSLPAAPEKGPMRDSFEFSIGTPTPGTGDDNSVWTTRDSEVAPETTVVTPTPGSPLPSVVPGPGGVPAPRYFEQTWSSDRDLVAPGGPVTVTLTLKNAWDNRIEMKEVPTTVTLRNLDAPSEEAVAVPLANNGEIPGSFDPGQVARVVARVPPHVTAGLDSGRYNVRLEIRFNHTPGRPEMGEVGLGLNSPILFVLLPSQGALEKTVVMNEKREVDGVTITLRWIEFTQRETRIVAIAVPPEYSPPEGPVSFPRGNMTGKYRVDGGAWRELGAAYRDTQEGVRLEWTLGPIAADAKTFGFAVTGFAINPSQQVTGLWEWTVPLEEGQP